MANQSAGAAVIRRQKQVTLHKRAGWANSQQKYFYLLLLPGILYFILFKYVPMFGVIIAFKDYKLARGIIDSNWSGLKWFHLLFSSQDFWIALKNTLIISAYKIIFMFPAPILLALLLNEVRHALFKRAVQTIVYLPHFLSWVVLGGIMVTLLSPNTGIIGFLGLSKSPLMQPEHFRALLVLSQIWKEVGWGTVIYLAAIVGINPELYESARIDGASRLQQIVWITIPSISSTIVILLILRTGTVLHAGFDQIFVLYNPLVYNVADVLDTYVYRIGLSMGRFSLATASGLFQSAVGLVLLLVTNWAAKRMGEEGIW